MDCIAQLGGLHEAQAALRRHMPAQLRLVVARAVAAFPASQRLGPQDKRDTLGQQQQRAGTAGGEEGISVPPAVAAAAQALVEHVLGCCLQVGGGLCSGGSRAGCLLPGWVGSGLGLHKDTWLVAKRGEPLPVRCKAAHLLRGAPSLPCCCAPLRPGLTLPCRHTPRLQVFRRVTDLLQALSMARVPKPSSGLELLLRQAQQHQHQQQAQEQLLAGGAPAVAAAAPKLPAGPPGPEATQAEVAAAWECLQRECQRLLADVLDVAPPAQQAQRGEDDDDVPLAGWLAAVGSSQGGDAGAGAGAAGSSPAAAAQGAGALSFSLTHEVEGLLGRAADGSADGSPGEPAGRPAGPAALEAGDVRAAVRAALGGTPGSPALVASLYRPVLQFAEAADRHVAALTSPGGGAEQGGRMAALLSMPWRAGGDASAAERAPLRSFVESFLRMEFLPAVYVSARCGRARRLGRGRGSASDVRALLCGCESTSMRPACRAWWRCDLQHPRCSLVSATPRRALLPPGPLPACPRAAPRPHAPPVPPPRPPGPAAPQPWRMARPSSRAPGCARPTRRARAPRGAPSCRRRWPRSAWWRSCWAGRRWSRPSPHTSQAGPRAGTRRGGGMGEGRPAQALGCRRPPGGACRGWCPRRALGRLLPSLHPCNIPPACSHTHTHTHTSPLSRRPLVPATPTHRRGGECAGAGAGCVRGAGGAGGGARGGGAVGRVRAHGAADGQGAGGRAAGLAGGLLRGAQHGWAEGGRARCGVQLPWQEWKNMLPALSIAGPALLRPSL